MAKGNKISFKDGKFSMNEDAPSFNGDSQFNQPPSNSIDTTYQPKGFNNSPREIGDNSFAGNYTTPYRLDKNTNTFTNTPQASNVDGSGNFNYNMQNLGAPVTYGSPDYYNQRLQWNQGLKQAQAKDATGALSSGFNERIYRILNQAPTESTVPQYMQMAPYQFQVSDLKDGSKLANPNDEGMGHQWNPQKLSQITGLTGRDLDYYMNQKFNWKAYNALLQAGAIEQTQASKDWQAYQQAQTQPTQNSNYDGGYYDSGYYDDGQGYTGNQSSDTEDNGTPDEQYAQMTDNEASARANAQGLPYDYNKVNGVTPKSTPSDVPNDILGRMRYNIMHTYQPDMQVPVIPEPVSSGEPVTYYNEDY